jgi:heat shock protein HslJ
VPLSGCVQSVDPLIAALSRREFVSEAVHGRTLVPETKVRMSFDREFQASAGCNGGSARFSVHDGTLVFENDTLSVTETGCEHPDDPAWAPAVYAQEDWFFDFLVSHPTIELDEPRLTVAGDEATIVMLDRTIAEPDLPLRGTDWTLAFYIVGDWVSEAVAFDEAGELVAWPETILRLADDGSFTVEGGCPTASGTYVEHGGSLALSAVSMRFEECPPEPAIIDAAMSVLADGTTRLERSSRTMLALTRGDVGLVFDGS